MKTRRDESTADETVEGRMTGIPRRRFVASLAGTAALPLVLPIGLDLLAPSSAEARVGARLQRFTLPAVEGGPTRGRFRADEYLGEKPIAILFWATWCAPCRQELPLYQELYERYDGNLMVVGISMDDTNSVAGAGPMARRLDLEFPVVSDLDSSVTSRLNPRRAAPFSIWVNRSGRIVREQEGFNPSEREQIETGIRRLVRGRRRPRPE